MVVFRNRRQDRPLGTMHGFHPHTIALVTNLNNLGVPGNGGYGTVPGTLWDMRGTRPWSRGLLGLAVAAIGVLAPPVTAPGSAQPSGRALREQIDQLRATVTALERELQNARDAALDAPLDRASASIQLAKSYLDHADLLRTLRADNDRTAFWADMSEFTLREAALHMIPSRSVEARGILLDSDAIPRTLPEVRSLVSQLAAARFNILIPEVVRRGYAIYPTKWLERDPEFANTPDVFAELLREAHRQGLEVHPWIWTFRVRSYDDKNDYGNPVLSRLPGLAARSETTAKPRFLSPAAPGSREFVLRTVQDLLDRYDVDGLFLDYIRYDEETPDDWISQTNYRLERLGTGDPWTEPDPRDYQLWREDKVNRVVSDLAAMMRARSRTVALSAATFRGESYTRRTKLQNWRHWADNAWLTFATSMLYGRDPREIEGWINQETDNGRRPTLFYPILGVHRMDDPARDLLEQIRVVRQQGQAGVLVFALGHLPKAVLADLARGPFRTPAVVPHRNPVGAARLVLRELVERYLPRHAAGDDWGTVAAARVLGMEVSRVVRSMPTAGPYYQSSALIERLAGLREVASRLERVNPAFQGEVVRRLEYAMTLLRSHAHRIGTTRYVPPTPPAPEAAARQKGPEAPRLD